MRIEPFKTSHLAGVVMPHPKQERHRAVLESAAAADVGVRWSAIADDGLVAVGGLVRANDGFGAWLLFTDRITPGRFVAIYRELARRLAGLLESGEAVLVHIDPDYPEASRLAKKLGFQEAGEDHLDDGRRMIRMMAHV